MSLAGPVKEFEIAITRVFDAPRELVFQAWTEPAHLMRWLCPRNFVVTLAEADVRPGGAWRSGMRSPNGGEYFMRGNYCEISPPKRLVFTHEWEDATEPGHEPGRPSLITIDLVETDGKTTMNFRQSGLSSIASQSGQNEGWSQAFDNLGAHLVSPEFSR